jgi:hypothetical protein
METKQTAVEWVFEQLDGEESLVARLVGFKEYNQIIEQAKAMEKEQIKDAFTDGCIGELYELNAYYTSEKYYNQTYKQQDNGK